MTQTIERIHVSVIDQTRPFAQTAFNVPLILGTSSDPSAVKDTLCVYSTDDLAAIAADFPVTTPEYLTAVKLLSQDPHPELLYIYSVTRSATPVVADLSAAVLAAKTACEEANQTMFYFVVLANHEEVAGDLEEVADTVSAQTMMLITVNDTAKTASQIVSLAATLNSDRVVLLAHDAPDTERPDGGIAGFFAGMEVGSLTLDTTALNNVAAATWNSSEVAALLAPKKVIPYVMRRNVAVTICGWTTDGNYADLRRCKDWIKARMTESLFGLKLQNPKIPQTEHGINMVRHALEGVLNLAASKGIVQKRGGTGKGRWEVDIPTLAWLSANDPTALSSRHLRTIRVRVWPVGAFEEFTVIVYLTWSLT